MHHTQGGSDTLLHQQVSELVRGLVSSALPATADGASVESDQGPDYDTSRAPPPAPPWPGDVSAAGGGSAVPSQERRSLKEKDRGQSAGRSHSEPGVKRWWYDSVGLSTRPVHAAS
ncbi:uncharacterized protein V6R79_009525 [Siganus canaliculatus]